MVGAAIFGFYLHQIRVVLARRPAVHDPKLLIGKDGVTKTELGPNKTGVVQVASDAWSALSDETIGAGEKIRVIEVEGLKLRVKRV